MGGWCRRFGAHSCKGLGLNPSNFPIIEERGEPPMNHVERVRERVLAWPQTSVHPHRFGGSEFRFGRAEIGHVHRGGIVDIPFPRPIRDALLANHLAEEHRWVPDSGWTTFVIRGEEGLEHAVWLLRLSYLRYALKTAPGPRELLEQETKALGLGPELASLLEVLIPTTASTA